MRHCVAVQPRSRPRPRLRPKLKAPRDAEREILRRRLSVQCPCPYVPTPRYGAAAARAAVSARRRRLSPSLVSTHGRRKKTGRRQTPGWAFMQPRTASGWRLANHRAALALTTATATWRGGLGYGGLLGGRGGHGAGRDRVAGTACLGLARGRPSTQAGVMASAESSWPRSHKGVPGPAISQAVCLPACCPSAALLLACATTPPHQPLSPSIRVSPAPPPPWPPIPPETTRPRSSPPSPTRAA